jgi:hypothetical protein
MLTYVCIYINMYTYVYILWCTHIYICIYIDMVLQAVSTPEIQSETPSPLVCMYWNIWIFKCVYWIYVFICAYVYICIYISIYIYIYLYLYLCIYMYTHIYVYLYMYIFIYKFIYLYIYIYIIKYIYDIQSDTPSPLV